MAPILEPTRRDLMVAGAAATLAASTGAQAETAATAAPPAKAAAPPADPATISGTVREDISRTGGHGITDLPIPDVLISNGRDIVRTDAMGRYSLPIEPGMTIFLIKPPGFAVATDLTTHLPLFAYVYEPNGTPDALGLRYPGLRPTGPLPAYIDFALIRANEPERFDVVLMTDPQPESTAEIEYVRDDIVAGLVGSSAAFGITAGDLLFDDLSMYGRFNRIVGRVGLPWWSVGGNHDLNFEAPDARRSRETFKRVFGATYYAHGYAGALFVMLDNVDYLGADPAKPGRSGKYRGFISADQLRFVANLLNETPAERLIVLVMHIPLTHLPRPEEPSDEHGQRRRPARAAGRPAERQLCRPYPFDGAPLPRPGGGVSRRHSAPPPRADGGVGLLVERPARPPRHRLRRQLRWHAQRLPRPVGRRRQLHHPLRAVRRQRRQADAHHHRVPGARRRPRGHARRSDVPAAPLADHSGSDARARSSSSTSSTAVPRRWSAARSTTRCRSRWRG